MSDDGADPRPIVAELGRPETPRETAERKAEASRRRRANQTTRNLVLALLASLAVVAFLILVVVRPDAAARQPVDYRGTAAQAQPDADQPLLAPELPDGWTANRARWSGAPSDDVPRWEVGFVTPGNEYIGLAQGLGANAAWVDDRLDGERTEGSRSIGGVEWAVLDRRDADDPGNLAYALVAELGGSTVVLAGTADDDEFAVLAEALVTESEGRS